jgi:rod shape-determining protein MreC
MSYLLDKKRKARNRKFFIAIAVVVLIGMAQLGLFSFLSPVSHTVLDPVMQGGRTVASVIESGALTLAPKRTLIKRLEVLQEEYNKQSILLERTEILQAQNELLNEYVGRTDMADIVVAAIISKPFTYPYGSFVVDQGSRDGVSVGDKVYVDNTVALGFVSKVYNNSSLVVLYSKAEEKVHAMLLSNNVGIDLIGRGGSFEAFVSRDLEIEAGDYVVTTDFNPYVLGKISEVRFDPREPEKHLLIELVSNPHELRFVDIAVSR